MLLPMADTCVACSMCELGRRGATIDGKIERDPHVFSNMNPRRIMVVGQNPGWNEVLERTPFVGESGHNFDAELAKHGMDRSSLYICNIVRCYTNGNATPLPKHIERCRPFLQMEINLIRPVLVASLGRVAFDGLCPGEAYGKALGRITKSQIYDVPVFAIYHPSPMNLGEPARKAAFEKQMRLFCGLVQKLIKQAD